MSQTPIADAPAASGRQRPGLTAVGIVGALVLLVWLLAWVVVLMHTKGRELALEEAWRRVESGGWAGVAEIGARAREVAALTRTLAQALESLPMDETKIEASLPSLLDFQGDRAIAGGGYWPEPFAFDPRRERRSFFWGRNAAGVLESFDDYNVSTAGYHREDWYTPARHLTPGRVYWSRTYLDPFTRQPMVTCTAPIQRDGRFHGAATVDLRLEGLQALAEGVAARTGGYAFVLDPYGRFITFPELRRVVNARGERITLAEWAASEPALAPLAADLAGLDADVLGAPSTRPGVRRVALSTDPRLNEPVVAFLFHVPETGWRLVVVKPESEGAAVASELVRILTVYLALGLTLALALAYLAADRLLIRPLRRTTAGVQQAGRLLAERRFELLRAHRVAGGGVREVEVLTGVLDALSATVGQVTSDLDRARTAAESASRAKSEFLAAMSHELRTPLSQIIGYAELLEEEAQDAGRDAELPDLHRIRAAASGLLRMVDDALAISQMESEKLDLQATAFDPWQLAEDVIAGLRPLADKNGDTLELRRPAGAGHAETDEAKLRVCLRHLVDNACGFTRDGRVDVVAESEAADGGSGAEERPFATEPPRARAPGFAWREPPDGGSGAEERPFATEPPRARAPGSAWREPPNASETLVFQVRDTGPGIPADKLDAIFERFTQLDRSSTRARDGPAWASPWPGATPRHSAARSRSRASPAAAASSRCASRHGCR